MSRAPSLTSGLFQRGIELAREQRPEFRADAVDGGEPCIGRGLLVVVIHEPARGLPRGIGLAQQCLKLIRIQVREFGNGNGRNAVRRRHDQNLAAPTRHYGRHQRAALEETLPDNGIDAAFNLAAGRSLLEEHRKLSARGAQMLQGLSTFRALGLRELRPFFNFSPQRPVSGFLRWREGQGLLAQRGSKE